MGYVPYVGFVAYRCATVKIRLYFKRLMFMQMFCIKKKKPGSSHHVFPTRGALQITSYLKDQGIPWMHLSHI
jgi:hypothetical protein